MPCGELSQTTTPTGNFIYTYDPSSKKLSKINSPDGVYNQLSYYGDIVSGSQMKRTSDNLLFGETKFNYDSSHRVSSRFLRGNPTSPTSTINYSYNNDNQPTTVGDLSLTYSNPSGRLSGTSIGRISDSYLYDTYGDLVTYTAVDTPPGGSSTVLYTYTLTRDVGGRISSKVETIQGVTATYVYSYVPAGRLTSVSKNGTVTDSFVYDGNSNRISGVIDGVSFSATYDDQDRILTYGSRTYTHNNNGDLTRIQWNVTDRTDIVHDVMGNVKQVTLPTGTVLTYTWDGYNRWIGKYSGATLVAGNLYEDQHRISATLNALAQYVREYVYATKVNVPDYLIMSGLKYRMITDHLGSPRLLVRTDNGAITQRMDYNTLGLVTADTNPTIHPFGFAGGLWDAQTMTVRFGARTYDPRSTGRWMSKDPIRFDGGDLNLYGYSMNDPINLVDSNGKNPVLIAAGMAAMVGAGANMITYAAMGKLGRENYVEVAASGAAAGALAVLTAGTSALATTTTMSGILSAELGSGFVSAAAAALIDVGFNALVSYPDPYPTMLQPKDSSNSLPKANTCPQGKN